MSYHNTGSSTTTALSSANEVLSNLDGILLQSFSMDFTYIIAAGETRSFEILGSNGAEFRLEVKNEDGKYYDFSQKLFLSAPSSLSSTIPSSGIFSSRIKFPVVTDPDQYDIFLFTNNETEHVNYNEVRGSDTNIDINLSSGSNSMLMTKVIHQLMPVELEMIGWPGEGITLNAAHTVSEQTLQSLNANKEGSILPFTLQFGVANDKALRIIKQPDANDFFSLVMVTKGTPSPIEGENMYPTITTPADSTTDGGTTVNGASTGTTVTLHVTASTVATVGDRVLGNDALAAATVLVTFIGGTQFIMNQAVSIADDLPLSFSNQQNYRWPVTSGANILDVGMEIIPISTYDFTVDPVKIANYTDTLDALILAGETPTVPNQEVYGVDTLGLSSTITAGGSVITQPGFITFDKQMPLASAGLTAIGAYGYSDIKKTSGYDIRFSDLLVTLKPISTTTTGAVSASTSVPVAERTGILDSVSAVSGIGVDSSAAVPTVASGAGAVTGAGTIVLTAAQTLESGITLDFANASNIATVSGNIEVVKAGPTDLNIYLDVKNIVSMT